MVFRDLESVRFIVKEATGLEISYAYEDLVFPDNTAFIIQFVKQEKNKILCHFQEEAHKAEREKIFRKLELASNNINCQMILGGTFHLEQKNEEENIHFKNCNNGNE